MLGLVFATIATAFASPPAPLHVQGNRLMGGKHPIQLRGVNRSGTEYACIGGWGITDSPHPTRIDDRSMIAGMGSWRINVVRVPLNEDCWLGINSDSHYAGATYRRLIHRYVAELHRAGLYVILDLHVAAPGSQQSTDIAPMTDADHAPAFWRSLAKSFRGDHRVLFDLYNEPHNIPWSCWRDGCETAGYRAAGMQQLVDAVRGTGATQPLMLGGVRYALDPSEWARRLPRDPRHALVLSHHSYGGFAECTAACRTKIAAIHRHHPVVLGELGENDCAHSYVDAFMAWADKRGIGYLGWAWDATDGGHWECNGGPSLIVHYDGTPTGLGVGFRDHFLAIARRADVRTASR